jgi:hypothetical protein
MNKNYIIPIFFVLMLSTSVYAVDTVFLSYNQLTSDSTANIVSLGNFTITNVYNINETDPIYNAKRNELILNASNGQTAYTWGNHASAGYVTGTPWTLLGYTTYNDSLVNMAIEGSNAYGWGDHHLGGYLIAEDDPEVDEVTLNKWCIGTGTQVTCNQTNPITGITSYNDSAIVNALQAENTSIYAILYETYANITGITSYNDSAVVNALQAENTSIYAILYETYANITGITSYNDSAVVNALQSENTTIWNALQELNGNDTTLSSRINIAGQNISLNTLRDNTSIELRATSSTVSALDTAHNLSIELRSPIASPSFTGTMLINGGYSSGGITATSNGSFLIYDDLLLGGDLLSVSTTKLNGTFLPDAADLYDLGSGSRRWNYIYGNRIHGVYGVYSEYIYSNVSTFTDGDMFTQGAGDDIWLGTNTQTDSLMKLYANGTLRASEIITAGKNICVTGGNCLNSITSYNDSSIVNALQGENITIWNILWETYSNITGITSYNDSSVVNALQGENVTIWDALRELNSNDTAIDNKLNLSIEQRTSYNDSTVVDRLQAENTTIWNILWETYVNITGITSYNDSAVVNALQSENTTIWNMAYEFNQNITDLNLSVEQRPLTSYVQAAFNEYNQNDTDLNLSIEQRQSYNDSAVVDRLQAENITIWNMAYEFNQNDTALNLSVEQRAPLASPSFTGTVTSAGAINETLAMGTLGTTYVTHIDFGNVSFVTNSTHFCLKGKNTICVES